MVRILWRQWRGTLLPLPIRRTSWLVEGTRCPVRVIGAKGFRHWVLNPDNPVVIDLNWKAIANGLLQKLGRLGCIFLGGARSEVGTVAHEVIFQRARISPAFNASELNYSGFFVGSEV